ncbi:EndoU domain-containing protein [Virgibacillus sp. W0181]|uniref:EndoU domain-containing protein n=1 Tax=Virgibacillus sp. W0181 TaxID=3391581 RepID=UPI003F46CE66
MQNKLKFCLFLILSLIILAGCTVDQGSDNIDAYNAEVTSINELDATDHFRNGALEHILEGEVNAKGQAVGFHYDRLPTKKGEIIPGTKTDPNKEGVFEAAITVNGVEKAGNNGKSSFFPDDWDTQEVIDAINDAYETKVHINGNTYDGLTNDGVHIRMYLDQNEKIISAFPIY